MAETPNHEYSQPEKGTEDWDMPINQNFATLDVDVEVRDSGTPSSNGYTPAAGAKYLDTDTGFVYVGGLDDNNDPVWTSAFALARFDNPTFGAGSVVLGEASNGTGSTSVSGATVGGGRSNTASGKDATVSGGANNTANSQEATIGGGRGHTASGFGPTIGGGLRNTVSGNYATVSGGLRNTASGSDSTVPGGAFGAATDDNSFVWNDETNYHTIPNANDDGLSSNTAVDGEPVTGAKTFSVSATGGVRFITGDESNPNVTYIPSDSAGWTTTSSRAVKTNIDPVEPREALAGVEELEVATWEYETEDEPGASTTHIGPMAEDFHDAFDVGSSDEHINSINADGVALAAIQGLSAELDERIDDLEATVDQQREELDDTRDALAEREEHIADLETENEHLRERNAELEARLSAVEDHLGLDAEETTGVAGD